MPAAPANIDRFRLAAGALALVGCLLAMWFSVLFRPLVYGLVVALFALWIGLWPYHSRKIGFRVWVAVVGSIVVCIVLTVVGLVIAFVRRDGLEEFGPVLFVPIFMVVMGAPIAALAAIVAAFAPRLGGEPRAVSRKPGES